jgi:hypothetical protein
MNRETIDILNWILRLFECLAAVTGLYYWSTIKHSYWKWFALYLCFIAISELFGWLLSQIDRPDLNRNFYHYLVIPVEFIFFFWLFARQSAGHTIKRLAILATLSFVSCWAIDTFLLNTVFYKTLYWFSSLSYTIGNLFLLLFCMHFLIRLARSNDILHFKHNPMFWVCIGLLIFYMGTAPYYGLRNMLYKNYTDVFWTYTKLGFIFNYSMYSLFITSFLCRVPNLPSSLPS